MVCNKIGHYMRLVYEKELIRMDCEFHIDLFGTIWFYHAKDIWVRCNNELIKNHDEIFSRFIFDEMNKLQLKKTQTPVVQSEEKTSPFPVQDII